MRSAKVASALLLLTVPLMVGLNPDPCRSDCYDAEYLCLDNQIFFVFERSHAHYGNVANRLGTKTWPRADTTEDIWREKRSMTSCHCAGWNYPREGNLFGEVLEIQTIDRYRCTGNVGGGGL